MNYFDLFTNYRIYDEPETSEGTSEGSSEGTPQSTSEGTHQSTNKSTSHEAVIAEKDQEIKSLKNHLKDLEGSMNLTEEQKATFQKKLEDLQNSKLTVEQRLQREQKKSQEEIDRLKKEKEEEVKNWRTKYHTQMINTSILSAAQSAGAYNPQQILDLLTPKTVVKEVLDDDGNSTGDEKILVKFNDKDKEGKSITLELDPSEALKRMSDMPEQFGNLFKNNLKEGVNLSRTKSKGNNGVVLGQGSAAYRESRKNNPEITRR